MNDVIQKSSVLYMEDDLLKGYAPFGNKLLIFIKIPIVDLHAQHINMNVCILSS